MIDWALAERIARTLAGNGTGKRSVRQAGPPQGVARQRRRGARLHRPGAEGAAAVGRDGRPPRVDRRQHRLAALDVGRRRAEPRRVARLPRPLGSGLRAAAGTAAGVELGLVSAFMAQRVLGQYDVALIGPSRPSRLMFVAPNLADAQRRLGARARSVPALGRPARGDSRGPVRVGPLAARPPRRAGGGASRRRLRLRSAPRS